jgi:hypothetical protein
VVLNGKTLLADTWNAEARSLSKANPSSSAVFLLSIALSFGLRLHRAWLEVYTVDS